MSSQTTPTPQGGGKLTPLLFAEEAAAWLVGAELASALGLGGLAPRKNLTRTPDPIYVDGKIACSICEK